MGHFQNLEVALDNLTSRGAFFTTSNGDVSNTMTISWGFVGFSWKKPVFIALIRPQRYTYEIMQNADSFTISIPYTDDFKNALAICGSKSGRDINKESEANIKFVDSKSVISPVIENCNKYYECKIVNIEKFTDSNFKQQILKECYPLDDLHYVYYGEIVNSYDK